MQCGISADGHVGAMKVIVYGTYQPDDG
jgi:hypothetical protein